MLTRKALKTLDNWHRSANRKPLLIRGARQVGKSTLVREFASKNRLNLYEINFEREPGLGQVFLQDLDPKRILSELALLKGWNNLDDDKTLIFFDEIQSCSEAIRSLRYFFEELPKLALVSSGSLVEFEIEKIGLPVGRIELLYMYPLNFEEFLNALNHTGLVELIKNYTLGKNIAAAIHEQLLELFSLYSVIGGLPEVVASYVSSINLIECQLLQSQLITVYRQDFLKYSRSRQLPNVELVFNSIPRYLGQKFKYSFVSRELRSASIGNALELLCKAQVAYKAYHTSANGIPLGAEINPHAFKVFFLDSGLAQRISELDLRQWISAKKDFLINRGAIAEQLVAQELLANLPANQPGALFYWHRESPGSTAEIDFVISTAQGIVPIEVKAGQRRSSKSLHSFLRDKAQAKLAIELCSDLPSQRENIYYLPLYLAGSIYKMLES